jgi:Nucleotidyl transferase of unknown function (DUF2204)
VKPTAESTADVGLDWEHRIEPTEWTVYHRVIREARSAGVRFAFGGAFATAVYTGQLRNTKDFDFYIRPEDREAMIAAVTRADLRDHFDRLSYDRKWIYRASDGDVIVDTIWAMANLRASVDDTWLNAGPHVTIRGEPMRAIPIEELIWSKLYVLQRERSDWGDVLNLIDVRAEIIDWGRLLDRLNEDIPLLAGALSVFGWLAPARAQDIPPEVWSQVGLRRPISDPDPEVSRRRADLLDSRAWFRRPR